MSADARQAPQAPAKPSTRPDAAARARITGATRLYAIVGDPIVQVRSPETFGARFAALGYDAIMVPAHVPVARFDTVIRGLMGLANLDGLIATVPFKAQLARYADRLGDTARVIGAINALRREADGSWSGDMFDGAGFVQGARAKGERVEGRRVTLFGAGGAGSAIACALAQAGVASLDLVDVDPGKASALAQRLRDAFPQVRVDTAHAATTDADMIVNASPVGMRAGDGLPGDIGTLRPGMLVGDVVITSPPTALVQRAIACGCGYVDGNDMHAGQLEALIDFLAPGARAAARGNATSASRAPGVRDAT